jgi:hypothetical protein
VDERAWTDYWSHRLWVIPAVGTAANGIDVRGYMYSMKAQTLVTNIRGGQYETDGKAYLGRKRDARDIPPTLRPLGAK